MTDPAPTPAPSEPDDSDPFAAARRRGRAARSALSAAQRERATRAVIRALAELGELAVPTGDGRVGLSRAVRDEVDVGPLAHDLRDRGWTVWLPAVDPPSEGGTPGMRFREWRSDDVLSPGPFAIPEPPADGRDDRTAEDLEVVVVPCVAVDGDGTRVGFGAGYYDRALAVRDRPVVVVAAFDVQVQSELLPRRSWDVPADVVVTDRRTFRPGRR